MRELGVQTEVSNQPPKTEKDSVRSSHGQNGATGEEGAEAARDSGGWGGVRLAGGA